MNTNQKIEVIPLEFSRYILQNQPSIASVSLFCFFFVLIAVLAIALASK